MSLPKVAGLPAGAFGHASSDKRIEILRLIGHSGSISQAARDAGVSYKAAWQAIDTLTNLAGVELVVRAVGGVGGGGASLSAAGEQLLTAAAELEQARNQVLARWTADGLLGARAAPRSDAPPRSWPATSSAEGPGVLPQLHRLSVQTSMRNQLPCAVQTLQVTGHIVQVTLALSRDVSLVSRITRESAELLALRPGLSVLALCKATAVTVSRAGPAGPAQARHSHGTFNRVTGRAARVSRAISGDEIAITLDAGLQLFGFATAGSGLRVGSRVQATLDESAVVVALAD
jgi:molybdate transport system regulatory protein